MRYKDIECSVCGKRFDDSSDVVVCPICGAPCHRECWEKTGGCIHESEHGNGYRWEFPKTEKELQPEKMPDAEKVLDGVFKNGEGVVVCPFCQAPNFENDMYCRNCHKPLRDSISPAAGSAENGAFDGGNMQNPNGAFGNGGADPNFANEEYARNTEAMYNSYNIYGGLDPDSLVDGIPVREYAVFVGGKAPGRIIRKISTLDRYGRTVSPMFAGLLGPIWFLRRKMIKLGAIMAAVFTVLLTASGLLRINGPFREMTASINALMNETRTSVMTVDEMRAKLTAIEEDYIYAERTVGESRREAAAGLLNTLAVYGVPACGFICGLSAYRKKVRETIMKTRNECTDMNTYMNELHNRGGTSAGLTLAGVAVCAFAVFMYIYFPMIIVSL